MSAMESEVRNSAMHAAYLLCPPLPTGGIQKVVQALETTQVGS